MGAPETGTEIQATGTWVTVQPGLPSDFTDVLDAIQGLLEALLVVLNIAFAILQVVKAFLIGLLDPILAIIEEIINQIEGLLQDIRQIGIYISGDMVIEPNFEALLGGYQAYERRMIRLLVDRTDPTRPNFSSSSGVFAAFIYVSVDTTAIRTLINVIQKFLRFFGQTVPVRAYTAPTALRVSYGVDGASLATFGTLWRALKSSGGDTPNAAIVQWQCSPPPSGTTVSFPYIAPSGFLVEVSTLPTGLVLAYSTRVKNAQPGGTDSVLINLVRDPKTGVPFRLYGGLYMIDIGDLTDPILKDEDGLSSKTVLVCQGDQGDAATVNLNQLVTDDQKFLLQRTFYVKGGFNPVVGPNQDFSTMLLAEDMPYEASFEVQGDGTVSVVQSSIKQATTVYVRVSAVTKEIADNVTIREGKASGPLSAPLNFWSISSSRILAEDQTTGKVFLSTGTYTSGDKSEPSSPLTVTFPASSTREYLDTVTAALAVLVLSRSDVPSRFQEMVTNPGVTAQEASDKFTAAQAEVSAAETAAAAASEAVLAFADAVEERIAELVAQGTSEEDALAMVSEEYDRLSQVSLDAEAALMSAEARLVEAEGVQAQAVEYEATVPGFQLGTGLLATGLENVAASLFPLLVNNKRFFERDSIAPEDFRQVLLRRCRAVANDLYSRTGSLGDIESVAVQVGEALLSFKWSDVDRDYPSLTILESLADSGAGSGVGLNPLSVALPAAINKTWLSQSTAAREPGFMAIDDSDTTFMMDRGSADYSPIIYNWQTGGISIKFEFCRNAFFRYDSGKLYVAAASVLNIAAGPVSPGTGNWQYLRLFPQGLPAVEAMLQEIIGWVRAIAAGLQGVTDVIKAYIEFLQARILELQALVQRIIGLLDIMIAFEMPSVSALMVTGNGTDGVLQSLILAENKPSDSVTSYGAGLVFVAGGLPTLLIELIQAIMTAGSQE